VRNDPRETKVIPPESDTQESGRARTALADAFRKLKVSQSDLITFEEYRKQLQDGKQKP
jgi:hypothetical protein